jgi:tRNA (mo5U34)-methyltransferase
MSVSTVSQADVDKIKWFHSIDIGGGIVTPGSRSLEAVRRKADLVFAHGVEGKSVLDIGAWDGAYSFEAERRGASRVLATDYVCWGPKSLNRKEGFNLAKRAIGSRIEEQVIDVPDLTVETVGHFDVVLFLGVFYHLKHPFLQLEKLAPIATDTLVLETETAMDDEDRPAMVFFPGRELNNDGSNWWAPNIKCVVAMMKDVGFKKVEVTPTWPFNGKINHERGRYTFHGFR